jgi:AhpD family alkylhydroperoxidase
MKLPQLSLRELFLLIVTAAMGCGWCVERAV